MVRARELRDNEMTRFAEGGMTGQLAQDPTESDDMERRTSERVFVRELPGGGFVAIEVTAVSGWTALLGRTRYRGEVIIERRTEQTRRSGHAAPAIAAAEGASVAELLGELFPIASSNVELAARCLERSGPRVSQPTRAIP